MEIAEIKKLIPFYIAGTLKEEERIIVENAWKDSRELQEEVEFWQQAQAAVKRYSQFYQEGHPTPEQILAVAKRYFAFDKEEHSGIGRHLRECETCRHDVEIIRSTYPHEEAENIKVLDAEQTLKMFESNTQIHYFPTFKFADIFAAAAVVLIIVTVLFTSIYKRGASVIPQEHFMNFIIPFSQTTRGNTLDEVPNLKFDSITTRVNITVYVPHSEIDSLRYAVSILLPSGADTMISNILLPLRFDNMLDTIRFEVARELFKNVPCNYSLILTETLPLSKSYLTPESYVYNFRVQ